MKGPVQSVEVSYLLHATEDPARVSAAVTWLLSREGRPETEELEGHFGNKIVRVRFHLTGEEATAAVSKLASSMPERLKAELSDRLGEMVDEHSALFIRLDKQKLVSGILAEGSLDPVRIKVKPRAFLPRGSAREFYAKLLLGEA
ncbi:MAG: hypothetical protein OK438_02195 [Thaumarchaeota archaeon]|nr:hypothetical protein [Nitrososphaerota archaeon]